jgi:hypothetical protein
MNDKGQAGPKMFLKPLNFFYSLWRFGLMAAGNTILKFEFPN